MALGYYKTGSWVSLASSSETVASYPGGAGYHLNPPPQVNRILTPLNFGGAANTGLNLQQLQAAAFIVPADVKVDQIGIPVTIAGDATSVGRMGIYRANANGYPDELVVDAGTYSGETTGNKVITLSPTVTLVSGVYFMANVRESGTSYQVRRRSFGQIPGFAPNDDFAAAFGSTPNQWGYRMNSVSVGALPDPFVVNADEIAPLVMGVRISEVL